MTSRERKRAPSQAELAGHERTAVGARFQRINSPIEKSPGLKPELFSMVSQVDQTWHTLVRDLENLDTALGTVFDEGRDNA